MTTGYVKKMISIKDWNCARTGYQLKIQGACTHPAVKGILKKWEETLFICSGCEFWKSLLTPFSPNFMVTFLGSYIV